MSTAATSTVLDILKTAGLYAQAIPVGEQLTADEAALILATWQRLIDSSSILSQTVFTTSIDKYTLTSGVATYTMGTDPNTSAVGTLSPVRPNRITGVNLTVSPSSLEIPLDYTEDDAVWRDIPLKTISGLPGTVFNDASYPLCTLYVYPVPNAAYSLTVYSREPLNQAANLTDNVVFPPGYERYWVLKLAIEIAPLFGTVPSAMVVQLMEEAEQNVRSHNSKSPRLKGDPALRSTGSRANRLFDMRSMA